MNTLCNKLFLVLFFMAMPFTLLPMVSYDGGSFSDEEFADIDTSTCNFGIAGDCSPSGLLFLDIKKLFGENFSKKEFLLGYRLHDFVGKGEQVFGAHFKCWPRSMPRDAHIHAFKWSPYGKYIAFVASFQNNQNLYIYDAESFEKFCSQDQLECGNLLKRIPLSNESSSLFPHVTMAWQPGEFRLALVRINDLGAREISVIDISTEFRSVFRDHIADGGLYSIFEPIWDENGTILAVTGALYLEGLYKFVADTLTHRDFMFFRFDPTKNDLLPLKSNESSVSTIRRVVDGRTFIMHPTHSSIIDSEFRFNANLLKYDYVGQEILTGESKDIKRSIAFSVMIDENCLNEALIFNCTFHPAVFSSRLVSRLLSRELDGKIPLDHPLKRSVSDSKQVKTLQDDGEAPAKKRAKHQE